MEKKYIINETNLNDIVQYKVMISNVADQLQRLCDQGDQYDISIGFQLGRIYCDLRNCVMGMYDLEIDIESHIVNDDDAPF